MSHRAHSAVVKEVSQRITDTFPRFDTPNYEEEEWFKELAAAKEILNPTTP
jgi:hypothetical protein